MDGVLVAFRLARYDKNRASELVKRLYGQATSSHGGWYRYRRRGLLDDVPHRRLIRGVLTPRVEDADRVAGWLRIWGRRCKCGGGVYRGQKRSPMSVVFKNLRCLPCHGGRCLPVCFGCKNTDSFVQTSEDRTGTRKER